MFEQAKRYMTCGIQRALPPELITQLWAAIDMQRDAGLTLDYLQVFRFEKASNILLAIKHTQERPARATIIYTNYFCIYREILDKTIYVIDNGENSTMLFAEEY